MIKTSIFMSLVIHASVVLSSDNSMEANVKKATSSFAIDTTTNSASQVNKPDDSSQQSVELVIYDFDQTLSCKHFFHHLSPLAHNLHLRGSVGQVAALQQMDESEVVAMFGGQQRIDNLHAHFDRLKQIGTVKVVILSHGYQQVIKKALGIVKLSQYFPDDDDIVGRDTLALRRDAMSDKELCIQNMMTKYQLKPHQVCCPIT